MQAYWDAANYLVVGQIYLQDNPLLREPLRPEHIKPRLLGHWGTSPGLDFIYVHLNRLITDTEANVIYLAGPGHGGPALVGNVYLEGTYSELYPDVTCDADGLRRLFRQFSTPGGIPSHVSVTTPGSIHEGGELGYVLTHALVHGRTGVERFHVRGFNEEGTTTTPFDMVVLNGMSRYHLCKGGARRTVPGAAALVRLCDTQLARHHDYVREHLDDMPEVRDWTWTD